MNKPKSNSFLKSYSKEILLLVMSMVLYSNSMKNGFVLDDDVVYLKNQFVQEGIAGIDDILTHGFLYGFNKRNDQSYRPIVLIDFAIGKSIFGNNAAAHHFINMLYYGILVILIYQLLYSLLGEKSVWLAFWVALLFAFHPVHTEVVANIKGRDDLLHAIFAVLSLKYAISYIDGKKMKKLYISLFCFFLALLSKEMAITLVAIIPLTIYFFRDVELKHLFKIALPYVIVLAVYFILRNAILDNITFEKGMSVINNTLAAADNPIDRFATNLIIFGNYILLLFYPHPLSWDYSYPHFQIVGMNNPWSILILVMTLTAVVFALIGFKNKSKYAWSLLFFLLSFSVVSNFFILIGATLGERFLFFPSLGFCLFLVLLIKDIDSSYGKKLRKYALPLIPMILILLPMAAKTVSRIGEWESNETLFISGVEATPNNSRAVSALASISRARGEAETNPNIRQKELEEARDLYLRSIKLYNDNTDALYNLGVTYNNLSNTIKARMAYERVLELSPEHVRALNNLGVIYFQRSEFKTAESLFLKAISLQADFQNSYANLGAVYHNLGDRAKAEQYYNYALKLNPADVNTRRNLNNLLSN